MQASRRIAIGHADLAQVCGAVMLTREEVPAPPYVRKAGVVDAGLERWRFDKNGDLTTYIKYGANGNPSADWKKVWSNG